MSGDRHAGRLRRWLLLLCAGAGAWGVAILLSGWFVIAPGPLRLSSRAPRNPFLIALFALSLALALAPAGARRRTLRAEWKEIEESIARRWLVIARLPVIRAGHFARAAAALIGVAVLAIGLLWGALVAGGADSYGYVSQARLWSTGTLRVEQPLLRDPPGGIPQEAMVPLGYRLAPDRDALVPVYAPGLPMTMALFQVVGGPDAVFAVMPLLAAVAVWATFALGATVAGPAAGVAAAVLLATSPAFVFQLTHAPMSDIPATAWWTLVLVLVSRGSALSALVAGLAAGAAILTRPNLVPLGVVPGALLLWNVCAARADRRTPVGRLLLFGLGTIPGVVTVAYLNDYWYGSPLASGYGPLAGTFYSWEHFWPNLERYPQWLADSQGFLVFAAAAAPFLLWRTGRRDLVKDGSRPMLLACGAFIAVAYLCYAFYLPFDAWWVLRFLLPAFPALFVLTSAALIGVSERAPLRARVIAGPLLIALLVLHAIAFGRRTGAYESSAEWRFATVGRYIAERLPERAVLFAAFHSGSARHYSGRLTVRYDHVPGLSIDPVIDDLERRGYAPFILLDSTEVSEFTSRFAGSSRVGALDWLPVATIDGVRIYDATSSRRSHVAGRK